MTKFGWEGAGRLFICRRLTISFIFKISTRLYLGILGIRVVATWYMYIDDFVRVYITRDTHQCRNILAQPAIQYGTGVAGLHDSPFTSERVT